MYICHVWEARGKKVLQIWTHSIYMGTTRPRSSELFIPPGNSLIILRFQSASQELNQTSVFFWVLRSCLIFAVWFYLSMDDSFISYLSGIWYVVVFLFFLFFGGGNSIYFSGNYWVMSAHQWCGCDMCQYSIWVLRCEIDIMSLVILLIGSVCMSGFVCDVYGFLILTYDRY